jgi:hypothetical protein
MHFLVNRLRETHNSNPYHRRQKMTKVRTPANSRSVFWQPRLFAFLGIIGVACIFLRAGEKIKGTTRTTEVVVGTKVASSDATIVSASIQGVPYYHCDGHGNNVVHMVFLHGAKFTKEDWKTSGILEQFCKVPSLSVSAVDLPVRADHSDLKMILTAMQDEQLISKPVTLVTPSASGKTLTDWMMTGNLNELPKFVNLWIPVAAGSVGKVSDDQVKKLKTLDGFSMLAIYGDKDNGGKVTSDRLETIAGAKKVELPGSHPVYLDSPDAFVTTVLDYLGISK